MEHDDDFCYTCTEVEVVSIYIAFAPPPAQHITVRYYIAADKTRGLNVSVLEQRVAAFYQDTLLVSKLSARVCFKFQCLIYKFESVAAGDRGGRGPAGGIDRPNR